MSKIKKYFYVYKIVHIETNEFYFGSRGCSCNPEEDKKYMGTMKTWKPDKTKLSKIILNEIFKTRDEAMLFEANFI